MGAIYEIPAQPVYNTRIRKLQNDDPANAETVFNPLVQALVGNIHAVKKVQDSFDCGFFDEAEEVAFHDETSKAHPALLADGNVTGATGEQSLEAHMTDPLAHGNIILDGNER